MVLEAHSPRWVVEGARDAARVRRALGDACVAVHHVGSTAVPGLAAVPVIDLLAEIVEMGLLERARLRLLVHGFRPDAAADTPDRRAYAVHDLITERLTVSLHCYPAGHGHPAACVALVTRLRADPDAVRAYEQAKRDGAKQAWISAALARL